MNIRRFIEQLCSVVVICCAFSAPVQAGIADIATEPIVTSGGNTAAKPNVMFMLDDSGSMDWDYMPDNAKDFSGNYGFNSNQCNGIYYDPSYTYPLPMKSDGTSYQNSSFTAAWRDGYNTGAGTVNLNTAFTGGSGTGQSGAAAYTGPAFYYTYSGAQISEEQHNYFNSASTFYQECNGVIGTAPGNGVFSLVRLATVPTTTITVSASGGATGATITINSVGNSRSTRPSVSSITLNGVQLMSRSSSSSNSANTVARNIASRITQNGFAATASGNVVNIVCTATAAGYTPVLTYSGTMSYSTTACPSVTTTTVSGITVNGTQLLSSSASGTSTTTLASSIASKITLASYSATVANNVVTVTGPTSASNYTPVITVASGNMTLLTQAFPDSDPVKIQNFANWYSYYSTRMLAMKSAAGKAFSPIDNSKRVGFMTMNNNVSPDIVDIADFDGSCAAGTGTCQKDLWYTKLYASKPGNSTPLREALSHVGQLYAHKFGNVTTYSATITVGGSGDTSVDSVTVGGTELMNNTSIASTSTSALASSIADQINAMQVSDFGATVSGSVITIYGTVSAYSPTPFTPVISNDGGGMTFTATAFAAHTTNATLNGILPADPMQYSCQQNYVILSTDGYWNGATTYKLDNTTVGQQDGTEQRPLNDGATTTTTYTTPYTTVKTTTSTTSGDLTIPWSRTQTVTANCTIAAITPPYTTTAPQSDSYTTGNGNKSVTYSIKVGLGLGTNSTSPATGSDSCYQLSATGTSRAWMCRGAIVTTGTPSAPSSANNNASVTDSNGKTWYLVSSGAGTAGTGCIADSTAFANFSTSKGACPNTPAVNGTQTTTTPQTQNEVGSGTVPTTVTTETATNQKTVQTVVNGVAGAESALTPDNAAATYTLTSTVSTVTGPTSDTCSGQNGLVTPCPNTGGTWANGTVNTSACVTPRVTAATTYSTATAGTTTGGTTVVGTPTYDSKAGKPTVTTTTSGGTSNTLADVAEYYYVNDLRDQSLGNCVGALGGDVCANRVPTSNQDTAIWQHMTTFTLGLGARGRMTGASNYQALSSACTPATDGDFCSVWQGATANGSTICSWQASGTVCNWPIPSSGAIENIDDLWHAAVNGRGVYFGARNSSTLADSLTSTLSTIGARAGVSASVATSNPNVSTVDNFVFSSSYTTVDWIGELVRQTINVDTGAVATALDWSAQAALDALAATSPNGGARNIYTYNPTAATHTGDAASVSSGKLKSFFYANLTTTEQSYFDATHIAGLSQLCASGTYCLTTAAKAAAPGANLVNFLRGDRTNEGKLSSTGAYYRLRTHVLGDLVNAEVTYVKQPNHAYGDTNYTAYALARASRTGLVYAASNDGMLHAFYAGGSVVIPGDGSGTEAWAYIPSLVMPNLYKLADKYYPTNHKYFVDGSPVTSDICPNAPGSTCTADQWRTILVGGLNLGGRGYYALDVTDPLNPKALWEFSDSNMGYTFGNPQVAKLADGTWVVMVASGYNNVPNADGAGGDGVGRLYILNAYTGALIRSISTGVGSTGTPSGLARIIARVRDPLTDNTVLEVYGGDLLGNLWRFDVNNNVGAPGPTYTYEAQLLATLKDAAATPAAQPITTKPEVGIVNNQVVVFVGTGRFLGTSDMTNTQLQTMYAIKDTFPTNSVPGTAIYNNPRATTCASSSSINCFVQQVATNTTCPDGSTSTLCTPGQKVRTGSNNTVNFATQSGWYINMPDSGERDNTDPTLALGTLGFTSNTPKTGLACGVLGYSDRWFLDYRTGAPISTSPDGYISVYLGDSFSTRPVYIRLPNNLVVELTRTSALDTLTSSVPIGKVTGSTRRTSWRELPRE